MIPLFDFEKYRIISETTFKYKGCDFVYFDTPVSYHHLYRTSRKINSFIELEYVAEVLIFLNPTLDFYTYVELMNGLADRGNGHTIRTYSEKRVFNMCDYVYTKKRFKEPYVRRYRKIVFNPFRKIPLEEKLAIVGAVLGREGAVTPEIIYNSLEELMMNDIEINQQSLAEHLKCSRATINRNITKPIIEIMKDHNKRIKEDNNVEAIICCLNEITNFGENSTNISSLKRLVNINNYSLLKSVLEDYTTQNYYPRLS